MIEAATQIVLTVLIVGLAVTPLTAIPATIYLWMVYLSDPARPRSWLVRMLAITTTIVTVVGGYTGFLALWRLLGLGPLPDVLIVILAAMLIVLGQVPLYKALRVYGSIHGGSRPTIPTNGESGYAQRDRERDLVRDPARDAAHDIEERERRHGDK